MSSKTKNRKNHTNIEPVDLKTPVEISSCTIGPQIHLEGEAIHILMQTAVALTENAKAAGRLLSVLTGSQVICEGPLINISRGDQ